MSRELSPATVTRTSATVTEPGFLFRLAMPSQTLRLSSRGDVTYRGELYVARGMRWSGIEIDAETGAQSGSVAIADADSSVSAIVLNDGVADRAASVWKFYGDGPTINVGDVIPVFTGAGDAAQWNIDAALVTITLSDAGGLAQFSPRRYITRQEGFNVLPPASTQIVWGNEKFILESA